MRTLLLMLLWVGSALAARGAYYLESASTDARSEALEIMVAAQTAGQEPRLVRSFEYGRGFQYSVLIDGFDSQEAAQEAAVAVVEQGGVGIMVYARDGKDAIGVVEIDRPPEQGPPEVVPDAEEILGQAVRALGGRSGGITRLAQADAVRFAYDRQLPPEGLAARHVYERSGELLRVDVVGLEGEVVDSTTIVNARGAWVERDTVLTARQPARAREILGQYGPEYLLEYVLEFALEVDTNPAYELLERVEEETVDGRACHRLEYAGGQVDGRLSVLVDMETWRLTRVELTTDAGALEQSFSDWRELDTGLVVPFHAELRRDGALLEVLHVEELSLPAEVDVARFRIPDDAPELESNEG